MFLIRVLLVVVASLSAIPLQAGVITNGDFSDPIGLNGFVATDTIVTEVTTSTNDFAQLATDGTFLRTLETNPFDIPTSNSVLSFDFAFSTTGSLAAFQDSFAASLITSIDGDFLDLFVVDSVVLALPDPSGDIAVLTGIPAVNDETVSITGFTRFSGGAYFSGRVTVTLPSTVLGEEATLYFDLFDQNDGAETIAAVDNITITSASGVIPEPASVATWSLMLLGITLRRRRR